MCLSRNIAILCVLIIACALIINVSGILEKFEVEPPLPAYYNVMKDVKFPLGGGPYYHDAPNWFDMWAARFTLWRNGYLKDPRYDSDTADNGAPVPLPPKQIVANGNKRPNPLERFDCVTSQGIMKQEKNAALPYYSAEVGSIYTCMDRPANQNYDWNTFKYWKIPENNMNSIYGSLDKPSNQSYDWNTFKYWQIPENNMTSIYQQLVPKCGGVEKKA